MSCPTWCTETRDHVWHHALVATLDGDTMVTVTTAGADYESPTKVRVTDRYDVAPATYLAPPEARTVGRMLTARGREHELGEALIRAADLAEGGGHAADALSDAQLDGTACVRCGATEGPMVPAGHGPRGQLFECTRHRRAGGEA